MVQRIRLIGDNLLGHDISIILLERNKGNYTSKEVYYHAKGFYLAGKRCVQNIILENGLTESLIFPSSVNFLFSIELFIKGLILYDSSTFVKGHKLYELYGKLSHSRKQEIEPKI